ncbi:hypothetical protein AB0J71_31800 [Nonomuraea sp. NPDC049637]|uniref:hypothetical protein n=1 Tax=Nonomuraea sp. NPDC049637 TaxID=3154356 RepID=UPI0034348EDB
MNAAEPVRCGQGEAAEQLKILSITFPAWSYAVEHGEWTATWRGPIATWMAQAGLEPVIRCSSYQEMCAALAEQAQLIIQARPRRWGT